MNVVYITSLYRNKSKALPISSVCPNTFYKFWEIHVGRIPWQKAVITSWHLWGQSQVAVKHLSWLVCITSVASHWLINLAMKYQWGLFWCLCNYNILIWDSALGSLSKRTYVKKKRWAWTLIHLPILQQKSNLIQSLCKHKEKLGKFDFYMLSYFSFHSYYLQSILVIFLWSLTTS